MNEPVNKLRAYPKTRKSGHGRDGARPSNGVGGHRPPLQGGLRACELAAEEMGLKKGP